MMGKMMEKMMSDYDRIYKRISDCNYQPKTDVDHLVNMILLSFDTDEEEYYSDVPGDYVDKCMCYVEESGGFAEFDYFA